MRQTIINAWKLMKHYRSFNALPTEGIRQFWYDYCKVCQKRWMVSSRNTEHGEIQDLMNNWDTFGVSYELFDIVGCVISVGIKRKDIYMGLNARKYLDQPYEHSAF